MGIKAYPLQPEFNADASLISGNTFTVNSAVGVTLTIQKNVTIIFTSDNPIDVYGKLIIGCSDIDTSIPSCSSQIGVCSDEDIIIITSDSGTTNKGQIYVRNGSEVEVCNTRFSKTHYGIIQISGSAIIFVDNSEFVDVQNWAIQTAYLADPEISITDTKFSQTSSGIYALSPIDPIDNCLFELTTSQYGIYVYAGYQVITNNIFNGQNGTEKGIVWAEYTQDEGSIISGNTFNTLHIAIEIQRQVAIQWNEFNNNYIGIAIKIADISINYNNFGITNAWAIDLECYTCNIQTINCSYNYFGSSKDPNVISNEISDICDDGTTNLLRWWPWYVDPVDTINHILPSSSISNTSFDCIPDNHPEINGYKLSVYPKETVLSLIDSPFYITNDVFLKHSLYVENGVEIIFVGDYDFTVQNGSFIVGCEELNTLNDRSRGRTSSTFSYIHALPSLTRKGNIYIEDNGTASFCNVIFNNLDYAIGGFSINIPIIVDNGEFNDNFVSIHLSETNYDSKYHSITDSLCNNSYYCFEVAHSVIDNCHFTPPSNYFIDVDDDAVNITNNLIEGDWNLPEKDGIVCIRDTYQSYSTNNVIYIMHNTIRNCYDAIQTSRGSGGLQYIIQWNNIENNYYAFYIQSSPYTPYIHYNNLINNQINFGVSDTVFYDVPHCNNNYFGTTDYVQIRDTIWDICIGLTLRLVTWFPYYSDMININDKSNLPNEYTPTDIQCGIDNYPSINGSKLDPVYVTNITLTSAGSPYYVIYDIKIDEEATLFIENNVEIIFLGDFSIYIYGSIHTDCTLSSGDIRGLSDDTRKVYIHGNDTNGRTGSIKINGNKDSIFCNTHFADMYYGIYRKNSGYGNLLVDNCLFTNIFTGVTSYIGTNIYDSHFEGCSICIYAIGSTLFNNYLTLCSDKAIYTALIPSNISFSTISGAWYTSESLNTPFGIDSDVFGNNITNNIIKDMYTGIRMSYEGDILWNNFSNTRISIYTTAYITVHYNNFIGSTHTIDVQTNLNPDFSFNFHDTIYAVNISNKILDHCDYPDHGTDFTGIAMFYPWFNQPISYVKYIQNDNGSSNLLTIDYLNCTSIDTENEYVYTFNPTSSPTILPTSGPTSQPTEQTQNPTEQTVDPTDSPSLYPSLYPSSIPTIEPTMDSNSPSYSPTAILISTSISFGVETTESNNNDNTSTKPNNNEDDEANIDDSNTDMIIVIAIIVGALLCVFIIIFVLSLYRFKKSQNRYKINDKTFGGETEFVARNTPQFSEQDRIKSVSSLNSNDDISFKEDDNDLVNIVNSNVTVGGDTDDVVSFANNNITAGDNRTVGNNGTAGEYNDNIKNDEFIVQDDNYYNGEL